ncbi:MAG: ribosome maturation factor RimM [Acidaminococcus sp.]|jgi:16S rRNA processing protein RimM|nr:ribosome maturation factor RimM [Acidaminococcus sp.]MCI2099946.1 ribosome maturation factor RimM [Acidaminococcus sp.]MCI2114177.1 ribosome maturation factor RimM [Acidaminococcus sp.]MCI2116339.1 ribosome maturation factor RimM [Acidaminococcus sp.]
MEKKIVIGKIVAPHGVRGEFRIMPLSEHPERYKDMKTIHLDDGRALTVVSLRAHKNVLLMQTKEITTMNEAELLRGRKIVVTPEELPPLPEGQFYVRDILGFTVVSPEGEVIGTMKDVITPATTDVFVIASPSGEEILVAAIAENIKKIDWEKKEVIVRLPEWI